MEFNCYKKVFAFSVSAQSQESIEHNEMSKPRYRRFCACVRRRWKISNEKIKTIISIMNCTHIYKPTFARDIHSIDLNWKRQKYTIANARLYKRVQQPFFFTEIQIKTGNDNNRNNENTAGAHSPNTSQSTWIKDKHIEIKQATDKKWPHFVPNFSMHFWHGRLNFLVLPPLIFAATSHKFWEIIC